MAATLGYCAIDLNFKRLSQHRIDWDEWPDHFDDRRDIFGFKRAAAAFQLRVLEIAHARDGSMLPNPRIRIVGTDAARICPSVDRQQAIVHCGGNVHWPAVDA